MGRDPAERTGYNTRPGDSFQFDYGIAALSHVLRGSRCLEKKTWGIGREVSGRWIRINIAGMQWGARRGQHTERGDSTKAEKNYRGTKFSQAGVSD